MSVNIESTTTWGEAEKPGSSVVGLANELEKDVQDLAERIDYLAHMLAPVLRNEEPSDPTAAVMPVNQLRGLQQRIQALSLTVISLTGRIDL
jgi:hypothetical protein